MSVHVKPIVNRRVSLQEWEEARDPRAAVLDALRSGRWSLAYAPYRTPWTDRTVVAKSARKRVCLDSANLGAQRAISHKNR